MRSRITVALFAALLVLGMMGCSKKEQPAQAPAAATGQEAQAPAAQPAAGQPGAPAGTPEAAPAAAPAPAPVAEQAPPPPPPHRQSSFLPERPLRCGWAKGLAPRAHRTVRLLPARWPMELPLTVRSSIPAGSGVTGVVSEAKSAGKFKGEAILAIRLTSVNVKGVPITSAPMSTWLPRRARASVLP